MSRPRLSLAVAFATSGSLRNGMRGVGPDSEGRTLAETWAYPDDQRRPLIRKGMKSMDPLHTIQAMSTPAIFFSGGGLLLLSLNARLIAIFNRVRHLHEHEETEPIRDLVKALHRRARLIRNAFAATLVGALCALASSFQLALGATWPVFNRGAVVTMGLGLLALGVGAGFFLAEVAIAVPSLEMSRHR